MNKTPTKLEKCPIVESIFEIRFNSVADSNIVFANIYGVLKNDFPEVESLPIANLPASVREIDENMKFQPAYKLYHKDNKNIVIQVGAKMIGFCFTKEYHGWNNFSSFVMDCLSKIQSTAIIDEIVRVGFRVINFIQGDVFKDNMTTLQIKLNNENIAYEETNLRTVFTYGKYKSTVSIINNAKLNNPDNALAGSVIDIDTYLTCSSDYSSDAVQIMNDIHDVEKKVFFNLLTDDFLKTLNPSYEE